MFTNFYSNKLFEKVGIQTKFQIKVREELSPVLRTFQRTWKINKLLQYRVILTKKIVNIKRLKSLECTKRSFTSVELISTTI